MFTSITKTKIEVNLAGLVHWTLNIETSPLALESLGMFWEKQLSLVKSLIPTI